VWNVIAFQRSDVAVGHGLTVSALDLLLEIGDDGISRFAETVLRLENMRAVLCQHERFSMALPRDFGNFLQVALPGAHAISTAVIRPPQPGLPPR
jgi:hypothetical protein